MHTGLGCLYRVVLVVDRARRARQIVDLVNLHIKRKGYIVAHNFKIWIVHQVRNITLVAREKIVNAQYVVTPLKEALAKV